MHSTRVRSAASPTASMSPRQSRPATTAASSANTSAVTFSRPAHPTPTGATFSVGGAGRSVSPSLAASQSRGPSSASPSARRTSAQPSHLPAVVSGSVAPSMTEGSTSVSGFASGALSGVAKEGDRFEPNTYDTAFQLHGSYAHAALSELTATLWCANTSTRLLDLYSCVTGQLVSSLPPLQEAILARRTELAERAVNAGNPTNTAAQKEYSKVISTPRGKPRVSKSTAPSSPLGNPASHLSTVALAEMEEQGSTAGDARVTAMQSSGRHLFVGFADGTLAVYDALLLQLDTWGRFHTTAVTAIALLASGKLVSASADGVLVLWDSAAMDYGAITRVSALSEASGRASGELCAMTRTPYGGTTIVCGFTSGALYVLVLAERPAEQTAPHILRAHQGAITAIAVVRDVLFTAAEDQSVCAWHAGSSGFSAAPQSPSVDPSSGRGTGMKLIKKVAVPVSVHGLLAEEATRSLWVAYADGLLERWSGNPDDDFGVEESVDRALLSKYNEHADQDGASVGTESKLHTTNATVKALLSLDSTQTMQWLALSSNGVNKVWYGHRNALEMNLATALVTLHDVITKDTEEAAAWRERASIVTQKELERRAKYICILEQLNEQRVLMRHYEQWRRAVLFLGTRRKNRTEVTAVLAKKASIRLVRLYFARWATFYDQQQRHMRGYVLAHALRETTVRFQQRTCFQTWSSFLVRRRLQHVRESSADALLQVVNQSRRGSAFHDWRSAVDRRHRRLNGVSAEQLALLAHKAQRQLQQRFLRRWMASHASGTRGSTSLFFETEGQGTSALSKFATHYAKLLDQRHTRDVLHQWRSWIARKSRYAVLAAVAVLRETQLLHERRLAFFLRWQSQVHARHTAENTTQLRALELALRKAEEEHADIFEKLQLQKQLDEMQCRQTEEVAKLAQAKAELAMLERTCVQLRAQKKQQQRQQQQEDEEGAQGDKSIQSRTRPQLNLSETSSNRRASIARMSSANGPLNSTGNSSNSFSGAIAAAAAAAVATAASGAELPLRGHMAMNAVFYRSLVDQQRLSPIVLAHMPLEEAVHHVMGQLKGNVVNLYTDLALFRQVKDYRRAGTSAVGILLEAFGEMKRMIVSTVRGASVLAASAASRAGVKATRWPLSMEALDCIPVHQCANVLAAIKTMVIAYDLLQLEDVTAVQSTCEEVVANADWVFLIARACYLRRKPVPPANNRQVAA